jgi:hypothetical protein
LRSAVFAKSKTRSKLLDVQARAKARGDQRLHFRRSEWLVKKPVRSVLIEVDVVPGIAGYQNGRQIPCPLLQPTDQRQAINPRHREIGHKQICPIHLKCRDCRCSVCGISRFVSRQFQLALERPTYQDVVIDREYARLLRIVPAKLMPRRLAMA